MMVTRGDFWAGIAVIVASMWILGAVLEREFIKRVQQVIDFLHHRDQSGR